MAFPEPVPGLVIRYSYLWMEEHKRGQEEGVKDRPCAVILVTANEDSERIVTVLPVTHTAPTDPNLAVEIPPLVKRWLKLDIPDGLGITYRDRYLQEGKEVALDDDLILHLTRRVRP